MNDLERRIDRIVHKHIDRAVYLHHELDMSCEFEITINQMVAELSADLLNYYVMIPRAMLLRPFIIKPITEKNEAQDSH